MRKVSDPEGTSPFSFLQTRLFLGPNKRAVTKARCGLQSIDPRITVWHIDR